MNYALVGYGRMGREIERVAEGRGHELAVIVDPAVEGDRVQHTLEPAQWTGVDVAFEFSTPETAAANVETLARAGLGVVCGTTGWEPDRDRLSSARGGVVLAANFSVGMNLFYRIVDQAARCLSPLAMYDRYVLETHHRGKVDAPSGTARALAERIRSLDPSRPEIEFGCESAGPVGPGAIHVASVRAGHEPGTHVIGFDGEHDVIRLTHSARGRGGFALGAVLAAEWIRGRTEVCSFDEVLEDLLQSKGGKL